LPGRLLFVGHGASCLGIAGAFGREDYVPWDVIGYWRGRWGRLCRKTKASFVFFLRDVKAFFRDVKPGLKGLTESMTFFPSTLSISRYLKLLPGYWKT